MDKKGEYHDFPSKFLWVTVPKNFVRDALVCHFFRVLKMFLLQSVNSRFSLEKFLSHSAENFGR